jgi:ABC-type bacteriocin/lantibiotic exporter with double-glycine peptidase domain
LVVGRFVAWGVPYILSKLTSVFEHHDGRSPWPYLFGYVLLRFLNSSGGLPAIRDALWAPVMQYSDREMSQLSFNHLLNLSFNWHMHRKTGEVLRILDRGAAINHIFELILFTIVPTFIDIVVALVAFAIMLDWTLSLLFFFVIFAYSKRLLLYFNISVKAHCDY